MESEIALSWPLWATAAGILFLAGVTQGALGFGFPAIATPLLTLMTDVKTAIILNLLPNFTVNCIHITKGGNWGASLGRYWPVAVWVMAGSFLGAQALIHAPQDAIRMLLGFAILAYLYQSALARIDWSWLARRKRLSAMVFGLTGGFFSGTVNQSLPPLLIYFTLLGLEITVMTQILNLCFLGGKATQAATLAAAGEIRLSQALANVPLTIAGVVGLFAGMSLQKRIQPDTYRRALRYILLAFAVVLLWQGSRWLFA